MPNASGQQQPLDASKLEITLNTEGPTELPELAGLKFGAVFTPHMLEVDWSRSDGWSCPCIKPFADIPMHPASSSLHYGLEVFEGLKAFRLPDSSIAMFRPDMNINRLYRSCERMCLPTFDKDELFKLLTKLVELEAPFVPHDQGFSLYIRPLVISTYPYLGVGPPGRAKLLIICSPVGPYFPEGFKAVKIFADSRYVRAWPGGAGESKCGGNYGPTIMPQMKASEQGYSQILWLFPDGKDDFFITECGAMNLFVYWKNNKGIVELTTFPLEHNLILPGITRDSILQIAKGVQGIEVTESRLKIKADVLKGLEERRIYEIFGCGTACAVSPIGTIHFNGYDYDIPLGKDNCGKYKGIGPLGETLLHKLWDIQYGRIPNHPWLYSIPISRKRENNFRSSITTVESLSR